VKIRRSLFSILLNNFLQMIHYWVRLKQASECSLKLDFYVSESRIYKVDIDNLARPVLNAIEKTGVYYNDSEVYNIEVTKIPVPTVREHLLEKLHVELWE